ncbi:glutamine ABC transporter ATP-binding protein [Rhodococcus sp. ACPA4]|uniref:amino acid ABC transporter ATP-binding protein n=1 Tax=Rhodococcus TaxID=1827 RepID=UPI000BB10715|nr:MULTISPECIES: amino acid ABC transporter ATP-binding protein [unclassified Rhodococcus (in: high G+C Gram-positive bacteria)]PBC37640.1 glutamine ABC transporter ATP-binding protein [Rhodococcus sp. ACPA4]RZL27343.1 MAG: amino acid ABC transporter ATP-binding protein [Rhodococcus sp. (in: high G+C Gram-positive bacteria)]
MSQQNTPIAADTLSIDIGVGTLRDAAGLSEAEVQLRRNSLSVHGVGKAFGERTLFSDVTLSVSRGEILGLIGPSGTGKSTLLRCMNLLEVPSSGEVQLAGQTLFKERTLLNARELIVLRRSLGMVFQHFNLFPNMNALENVVLAQVRGLKRSRAEAEARAVDLLTRVGLKDAMRRMPSELSGGMQQRVAIARALALDPKVLLLDEPTSAIDPELRIEVRSVVSELAESGVTMVLVTHELDFVRKVATKVAFLADGGVVEEGSVHEVLSEPQHERTRRFLNAVTG